MNLLAGVGFKAYEYHHDGLAFTKMKPRTKAAFLGSILLEVGAPIFLATS